jgi:hypothetical protein
LIPFKFDWIGTQDIQATSDNLALFPLPAGEGQGEGERPQTWFENNLDYV